MKQTVDFQTFRDTFRAYGRDNFSREGLELLFYYCEEVEAETQREMELDVVALCCDYNEAHWETIAQDYNIDFSDCADEEDKIAVVREYLEENTSLIGEPIPCVFLYAAF